MTEVATSPGIGVSLAFGETLRRDRQNRAPDVLNTIANLSNDEVFTPPEFAGRMLDTIAEAWAADHGGAPIWEDEAVTFLDPAVKSGVFLREITKRLVQGQGNPPEGSDERRALVDRILTKQVFGIGMTTLTALLSRRSIYCSKDATSAHSVAPSFDRPWGNVWFERTEHDWVGRRRERQVDPLTAAEVLVEIEGTGRCAHCSAAEAAWGRGRESETHAYKFIHSDNPAGLVAELFGADVHFDVIVGNPPYQLNTDQVDTKITGTIPLYHHFIEQAKRLRPRFLSMVVPARWTAGGRGLDAFRAAMLKERHIREFVDYPVASDVFGNGVEIGGGVCYFLWDSQHSGPARVSTVRVGEEVDVMERELGKHDVFVRDNLGAALIDHLARFDHGSVAKIASGQKPFGIGTNFTGFTNAAKPGDLTLHYVRPGKRLTGHVARSQVTRGQDLFDVWKVFTPEASDGRGTVGLRPAVILGRPIIAGPGEICTNTYLAVGPFESKQAAESFVSYYQTKFFRFLVSLRKITQHASNFTYTWVPMQTWDRLWTDEDLYAKYGLSQEQIDYIESQIKPMDLRSGVSEDDD